MPRFSVVLTAASVIIALLLAHITDFIGDANAMGQIPLPSYLAAPYDPYASEGYQINPAQIGLGPSLSYDTASSIAGSLFGAGVTIGIVDAGVDTSDSAFTGRISTICDSGTCSGSSHGTLVAKIAAGAPGGIAPWATIVDASWAGTSGINGGIIAATNAGAKVINISLSGGLGATDGINYAASHGVTVVIAGGNNGSPALYDPNEAVLGFTSQALSHIIVVGGVTSTNTIQGMSNYPSSEFIGTTGTQYVGYLNPDGTYSTNSCGDITVCPPKLITTFTGPSASLQSFWLMAPSLYTSYAAPQVTGAIALLDARWPVLFRNGTTAQVLFDSAQNLGDPTIYGNGLLRIDLAFQPIGTLEAQTIVPHLQIPVSNITPALLSSGAFGSLSSISASLSHFTAFDSFQRDFTIDLSGLITTHTATSSALTAMTAAKPTVSSLNLADGSSLAFGSMENVGNGLDHPAGDAGNPNWFVSFTDRSGSTVAAGSGFPASASFANALWGNNNPLADQSSSLGMANALASLAEGSQFVAFGTQLDRDTRMAISWSQTPRADPIANNGWETPDASAFSAGVSTHMTSYWTAGLSLGVLNEQAGLLGATYDKNGPLSLGNQHQSMSLGVSSAFNLSDKSDLLLETSMARSDGSSNTNSLISDVSTIYTRSLGASLVERDAIDTGDQFELSVKSPLRVVSGTASLAMTSVDSNGFATTANQNFSLKPDANEMDLAVSYHAPLRDNLQWNVSVEDRQNADNIAGASEIVGIVGAKLMF